MENRGVLRGTVRTSGAIRAVTVSTLLVPLLDEPVGGCRGMVSSVHRSVVNVVVNGAFVTIAGFGGGGLPNGLLVAEPFDPRSLGIRAGAQVRVKARSARHWSPELRSIGSPPDRELRAGRGRRAVAARGGGLHGLVSAADAFAVVAGTFASGSEAAIVQAGRGLVGLGAGLTPAGDDVLVGLTAALTALGDERARGFADAWARYAVGRTTMVAESFHRYAALGAYSERLHDVLRAILAGPVEAIPAAVQSAAAWGATSGTDTLAGILLALDPVIANREHAAA
jgi:hypothetical protein